MVNKYTFTAFCCCAFVVVFCSCFEEAANPPALVQRISLGEFVYQGMRDHLTHGVPSTDPRIAYLDQHQAELTAAWTALVAQPNLEAIDRLAINAAWPWLERPDNLTFFSHQSALFSKIIDGELRSILSRLTRVDRRSTFKFMAAVLHDRPPTHPLFLKTLYRLHRDTEFHEALLNTFIQIKNEHSDELLQMAHYEHTKTALWSIITENAGLVGSLWMLSWIPEKFAIWCAGKRFHGEQHELWKKGILDVLLPIVHTFDVHGYSKELAILWTSVAENKEIYDIVMDLLSHAAKRDFFPELTPHITTINADTVNLDPAIQTDLITLGKSLFEPTPTGELPIAVFVDLLVEWNKAKEPST